jgi:GH25 family lysozyme M1 (1,4-beta-N-acetylmuramidase)
MPKPPRRPFRAGHTGHTGKAAAVPDLAGPVVLLADVSEFQPDVADAAYLAWSKAIVIRALYGTVTDKAWYGGGRRAALHAGGARFTGIYAYITAGENAAVQARALVALLRRLEPGEKIFADIEEGAGNQQARWVEWADTVHAGLGDDPWDYSGLDFAAEHGLAPVDWVASYGGPEPAEPHRLWQFTDSYDIPGVGAADCSLYHGTISQLAAHGWHG